MSSRQKPDLIQELISALRLASVNFVMFSQAISDKVGINSTDNECLDLLQLRGSATAGELAKLTGLTSGSITALIDRLEKAGYAKRKFDQDDRRKVVVVPNLGKINREISPYPAALGARVVSQLEKYSERELKFLLNFFSEANETVSEEITKLREK